jgi:hypothetical protein
MCPPGSVKATEDYYKFLFKCNKCPTVSLILKIARDWWLAAPVNEHHFGQRRLTFLNLELSAKSGQDLVLAVPKSRHF